MANISTEKIKLKTGAEFQKMVKYSKGIFSIELPSELCNDLFYKNEKDKSVFGKTEIEVNSLFKTKLVEWDEAVTKVKKVIIFDAKFQGALAKESFKHKWENGYTPSYKQNGILDSDTLWEFHSTDINSSGSHLGLLIRWAVYEKKQFKDKKDYKFVSGRHMDISMVWRNELDSGLVEIDHTVVREQFFLELDESFARMIAKVHKALGDLTPEKLILLAESKMKLLG